MKNPPEPGNEVICEFPYGFAEGTIIAVHGRQAWMKTKTGTSYVWDWSDMELLSRVRARIHPRNILPPHHQATPRD